MFRFASIALVLVAPVFVLGTTYAHSDEKAPVTQAWSVTFVNETAVIRATKETEAGFVQATIKSLQKKGVENFALRSQTSMSPKTKDGSITIRLDSGEAELSASYDFPYKYVEAIVSMLAKNDVQKMKFAPPKSQADAVQEREIQEAR